MDLTTIDFNELAKECHANAVSKGFYDEEPDQGTRFSLVMEELGEASNAYRKGKIRPVPNSIDDLLDMDMGDENTSEGTVEYANKNKYLAYVKDTVGDELADVVIRLMDYSAYKGYDCTSDTLIPIDISNNFGGSLMNIDRCLHSLYDYLNPDLPELNGFDKKQVSVYIASMIDAVFRLGEVTGHDISKNIILKMKYNRTRPHKHGKAY